MTPHIAHLLPSPSYCQSSLMRRLVSCTLQDAAATFGCTVHPDVSSLPVGGHTRPATLSVELLQPPCLPEGHQTDDGERVEFARSSAGARSGFGARTLVIERREEGSDGRGDRGGDGGDVETPLVVIISAAAHAVATETERRYVHSTVRSFRAHVLHVIARDRRFYGLVTRSCRHRTCRRRFWKALRRVSNAVVSGRVVCGGGAVQLLCVHRLRAAADVAEQRCQRHPRRCCIHRAAVLCAVADCLEVRDAWSQQCRAMRYVPVCPTCVCVDVRMCLYAPKRLRVCVCARVCVCLCTRARDCRCGDVLPIDALSVRVS